MGRTENVAVFEDTAKLCKSHAKLKEAVQKATAGQKLILETDSIAAPDYNRFDGEAKVVLAAKNVIKDYLHAFKNIEFAVYCSPRDEQNYKIFERVLKP